VDKKIADHELLDRSVLLAISIGQADKQTILQLGFTVCGDAVLAGCRRGS
jgi:hypothetical protein